MKNINDQVFLTKIKQKIKNGDYDKELSIPFMSRTVFYNCLEKRLNKRVEKGGSPILSDAEIDMCLHDVKEFSGHSASIFLSMDFIRKTELGFELTSKGKLALKTSIRYET